jgi:predicted HNH restriction endonuclease
MTPGANQLLLVGHIVVGWIGQAQEAAERLGLEIRDLWEAEWYVTASTYRSEPFDLIDVSGIATALRFESKTGKDRLTREPGRTYAQQLQALRRLKPSSASLLEDIWYAGQDIPVAKTKVDLDAFEHLESYCEGRKKLRSHFLRERNSRLVQDAKHRFTQKHGHLFCEVCGFDFGKFYGEYGEGYIEAHHKTPFSELDVQETHVSVDDLRMVCSNCHRMIHRKKPWLSVEQLREMIHNH